MDKNPYPTQEEKSPPKPTSFHYHEVRKKSDNIPQDEAPLSPDSGLESSPPKTKKTNIKNKITKS